MCIHHKKNLQKKNSKLITVINTLRFLRIVPVLNPNILPTEGCCGCISSQGNINPDTKNANNAHIATFLPYPYA